MGSLFMKNFKRNEIDSEKYLHQLIHYIHNNPVAANIVETPHEWKHSSYNTLVSDNPTFLLRKEVLDIYDGVRILKLFTPVQSFTIFLFDLQKKTNSTFQLFQSLELWKN